MALVSERRKEGRRELQKKVAQLRTVVGSIADLSLMADGKAPRTLEKVQFDVDRLSAHLNGEQIIPAHLAARHEGSLRKNSTCPHCDL